VLLEQFCIVVLQLTEVLMMRFVFSMAMSAILLAGAGWARAGDDPKKNPKADQPPAKTDGKDTAETKSITGTVKKMDFVKKTVIVTDSDGKDVTVKVTPATGFYGTTDKKLARGIRGIRKGLAVNVEDYDPATMNAKKISLVKTKKATADKTAKKATKPDGTDKKPDDGKDKPNK
jgi:hypothetical protein